MQQFLPQGDRAGVRIRAAALLAAAFVAGVVTLGANADSSRDATTSEPPAFTPQFHWWRHIYAHTMQEEAFLQWMNQQFHGSAWRHTMQEAQIAALYAWWCKHVWNPANG